MIDKKGFTLIELLAVITILGILMLVAIPAVSRTIENARKNTFITTAQTYVEAVRNSWAADEISCDDASGRKVASALPVDADYYVEFDTEAGATPASNNASALIGDGGKSSWGSAEVKGYVLIHVASVPASGGGYKKNTTGNLSDDDIQKTTLGTFGYACGGLKGSDDSFEKLGNILNNATNIRNKSCHKGDEPVTSENIEKLRTLTFQTVELLHSLI